MSVDDDSKGEHTMIDSEVPDDVMREREAMVSAGLMKVPAAAEFLRISVGSVYLLMKEGRLPCV